MSDRLFAPPALDAAKVEARQSALPPRLQALIQRASDLLVGTDPMLAQPVLAEALAVAPEQPDVLRLYGLLLAQIGNLAAASANFEAALRAAPDDAMGYWQYARMRAEAGAIDAALELRHRAVVRIPGSPLAWADLGEHLYSHRSIESALPPLERAAELAPDYAPGLFKLGNAYVACGRTADGVAMIRRALAREPAFGAAWMGLVDVKTVPVTESEVTQMRDLLSDGSRIDSSERTAIEFALAMVNERTGRYREAWEHLVHANARRKRELPSWSVEDFRAQERKTEQAFAAETTHASDQGLGSEVIFVLGMPRSGTTLVEQVLAAHPRVQGAGELAALPQALTEESAARQRRYPDWVPEAGPADWQRMGQRYLELTASFRKERPYSTDKLPGNWRALGAIRAMLPGAHIIISRRDPLENCWSCFKQYFPHGWQFTCDIDELAAFWKAFDRAATHWAARDPAYVREQGYEAITESPETEIRGLLDFCGLPFDDACLHAHLSRRSIHTLSAAQVREPIHRHRSIAMEYGELLDPLRKALGTSVELRAGMARAGGSER
ncbi:MAG: sulfotransferase [Rhodanobacteraceae bacterium]